jgi:UDP-2,3-diacylglucosamine hydrolase
MLLGSSIIRALGRYDVGQAVIIRRGAIEAIEAAEGTDRMVARVAARRRGTPVSGGILVKRPKPGQEMRVDLPTIGPATIAGLDLARLSGVAVLAGATLMADRETTVAEADRNGLFVYGFSEDTAIAQTRFHDATAIPEITTLGRQRPAARDRADAGLGAGILACLPEASRSGAVVVSRGYVLGLELGGGVTDVFQRAANLKQWGEGRFRRRTGVAVLGSDVIPDAAMVAAARHLRAIVVTHPRPEGIMAATRSAADKAGLAVLVATPPDSAP